MELPPSYLILYSILHISLFCVQEIDMYLELCHVSAARSLEQILFSQIHLFLTGIMLHIILKI